MPTNPLKVLSVANLSRAAARRYDVPAASVFARVTRLRWFEGFSPTESFLWGVADPRLSEDEVARVISRRRLRELQERQNPMSLSYLTEDKATFYAYCAGAGLRVPALFGVYHPRVGWSRRSGPLESDADWRRFFAEETAEELVIKPSKGVYARGLRILRRRDEDVFVDPRGEETSLAMLRQSLDRDPDYDTFVIQERLTAHPELRRLSDTQALQTVRAVTLVDGTRRPRLLFACLKVVVGQNLSDNFESGRSGNLLADIDLDSGRLELVRGKHPSGFGLEDVPRHPHTGVDFDRFVLPHWPKLRRLVENAAIKFLPIRTIGWDVAITPDGPSILEGNLWWDPLHNAHHLMRRYVDRVAAESSAPSDLFGGSGALR